MTASTWSASAQGLRRKSLKGFSSAYVHHADSHSFIGTEAEFTVSAYSIDIATGSSSTTTEDDSTTTTEDDSTSDSTTTSAAATTTTATPTTTADVSVVTVVETATHTAWKWHG